MFSLSLTFNYNPAKVHLLSLAELLMYLAGLHTLRSYGSPRNISGAIQKADPTNDNFRSLAGSSTTSLARPKSVTKASLPRAVTLIRQFCKQ